MFNQRIFMKVSESSPITQVAVVCGVLLFHLSVFYLFKVIFIVHTYMSNLMKL